jgi:hypothetical protein
MAITIIWNGKELDCGYGRMGDECWPDPRRGRSKCPSNRSRIQNSYEVAKIKPMLRTESA